MIYDNLLDEIRGHEASLAAQELAHVEAVFVLFTQYEQKVVCLERQLGFGVVVGGVLERVV